MRYPGGKTKLAKWITDNLKSIRKPGQLYVEPFLGTGCVAALMDEPRLLSDFNPGLIALHRGVVSGDLEIPENIDEAEYYGWLSIPGYHPIKTLIGYGASFGGVWRGGYGRACGRSPYGESVRGVQKIAKCLRGAELICSSYNHLNIPAGSLVYCDPPYHNHDQRYEGMTKPFPWAHFLGWAEALEVENGCTIVISEQRTYPGWRVWKERAHKRGIEEQKSKMVSEYLLRRINGK